MTLHIEEGFYGHDTFLLDVTGMGSRMKVNNYITNRESFIQLKIKALRKYYSGRDFGA